MYEYISSINRIVTKKSVFFHSQQAMGPLFLLFGAVFSKLILVHNILFIIMRSAIRGHNTTSVLLL
jgi:hypothetical protein